MKVKVALLLIGFSMPALAQESPAPTPPDPNMQALYAELLDAVTHGTRLRQQLFVAQGRISDLEKQVEALKPKSDKPAK